MTIFFSDVPNGYNTNGARTALDSWPLGIERPVYYGNVTNGVGNFHDFQRVDVVPRLYFHVGQNADDFVLHLEEYILHTINSR